MTKPHFITQNSHRDLLLDGEPLQCIDSFGELRPVRAFDNEELVLDALDDCRHYDLLRVGAEVRDAFGKVICRVGLTSLEDA